MSDLMQRAAVDATATHLVFRSGDGVYTDSLTLEQAAAEDVLLVHQVNGVPLPPEMGQPLRLICPGRYGYKYVKWVEQVEAIDIAQTPFRGLLGIPGIPHRCKPPRIVSRRPTLRGRISRFVVAERVSHWLYALLFIVAFVTGLLMWIPSTRAWLAGTRYTLSQYHGYVGAAMVIVPLLLLLLIDRRRLAVDIREIDRWDPRGQEVVRAGSSRPHSARPADARRRAASTPGRR